MNRSEFEELELQIQQSDLPLKLYLQQVGVSYSTYHYWRKKCAAEKERIYDGEDKSPASMLQEGTEKVLSWVMLVYIRSLK